MTRTDPPDSWCEVLRWDDVTGQWAEVTETRTKPEADREAIRAGREYPGRYLVRQVTEQVLTIGE